MANVFRRATAFFLFLCTPLCAKDLYGFDAADRITTFQCMQEYVTLDFFIASLINATTGSVDSVGVGNILRASEG